MTRMQFTREGRCSRFATGPPTRLGPLLSRFVAPWDIRIGRRVGWHEERRVGRQSPRDGREDRPRRGGLGDGDVGSSLAPEPLMQTPPDVVDGVRDQRVIAPAFMLNALTGVVVAVLLVLWRHWVPALLTTGFGVTTLGAFDVASTVDAGGRWCVYVRRRVQTGGLDDRDPNAMVTVGTPYKIPTSMSAIW